MTEVNVTEFRKNIQSYLREVQSGYTVRLLKHGKVVAVLSPPTSVAEDAAARLKLLRERAVVGDVTTPIGEGWEADGVDS